MNRLTVVIPTREPELPKHNPSISSLNAQTFRGFDILVQPDHGRGANWARNAGFIHVKTELVLFCDDDIFWRSEALDKMVSCLDEHPEASYVYCGYEMGGRKYCMRPFDASFLRHLNFVSTMSIIRAADFAGFDESIQRFQDWDLWLTMLAKGKFGVWCGECLFSTPVRNGITYSDQVTATEATFVIKRKHRL